jgi:AAA+ ATPase superfamily predicted ATPase
MLLKLHRIYIYTANTSMFVSNLTKSFKQLPASDNYISKILSNGYVAHYNTKANVFFNRKRELNQFTNAFSDKKPQLHVILGPPSTGKTALIREIVTKNKNFNPLFINCRNGQFDTPENIYNSISMQFQTFADKQKELLKKVPNYELEIKGNILDFLELKAKEEITNKSVSELLHKISSALPNWSFWNG